jgi:hypothetical protein
MYIKFGFPLFVDGGQIFVMDSFVMFLQWTFYINVDKVMDESYLSFSSNICAFFIILNMENMNEKLEGKIEWKNWMIMMFGMKMDDDGDLDGIVDEVSMKI